MDILEFAIKMEQDGERFYRDIVSKTSHKGIRAILTGLADDEKKHAEVVRKMQSQTPQMKPTTILDTAKNVFVQMKDFGGEFTISADEEQLYRQAMKIEDTSVAFYLDRMDQADRPDHKALFKQLAEEEKKHYRIVDYLADFVAAPKTWLADAEFERLGDY